MIHKLGKNVKNQGKMLNKKISSIMKVNHHLAKEIKELHLKMASKEKKLNMTIQTILKENHNQTQKIESLDLRVAALEKTKTPTNSSV